MSNRKGQVIVEFALVLPLLLLFTFGIIDFGHIMYARNSFENAAAVAARTAATSSIVAISTDLASACDSQSSSAPAKAASNSLQIFLKNHLDLVIDYKQTVTDSTGTSVTRPAQTGDIVQVTLTCNNFPMITPFNSIMALVTNSSSQVLNLKKVIGQATMRYE